MEWTTIALTALALSMDAFAASVCSGITIPTVRVRDALLIALFFGGFQFIMPVLGFLAGTTIKDTIEQFDHWIAFVLLLGIGLHMIYETIRDISARKRGEQPAIRNPLELKTLLILAVATSIDALAVGISFAFLHFEILPTSLLIGAITFSLSFTGVMLGKLCGPMFRESASIIGGLVLIGIGARILIEHLTAAA